MSKGRTETVSREQRDDEKVHLPVASMRVELLNTSLSSDLHTFTASQTATCRQQIHVLPNRKLGLSGLNPPNRWRGNGCHPGQVQG